MDEDGKIVPVEITGHLCKREIELVGKDLVPGETLNRLVLKFPDGKSHLVKVHDDCFKSYLEAILPQ